MDYEIENKGAVTKLYFESMKINFFVTSDVHYDSIYCNRDQFIRDLQEAQKRDALICLVGDLFDAMNGRFDPRRDMSKVRKEYLRADYYDALVEDMFKALKPFAKNIILISDGNHETSTLKNANTHLTDRLTSLLNGAGGKIAHGGYGGYLKVIVRKEPRHSDSILIKFFHGSGGEAPVTRGVIQTNRQAVFLPDADIVLNGHSHNQYIVPITRERVSDLGVLYFDNQYHVRTPGYCMSYGDGSGGWEVERGGIPKPTGGCFITYQANFNNKLRNENYDKIKLEAITHNPIPIKTLNEPFDSRVFPQE